MKREKPYCEHCGSEDVRVDAWAVWDSELQAWELGDVYDNADCEKCGGETSLGWIEIEED